MKSLVEIGTHKQVTGLAWCLLSWLLRGGTSAFLHETRRCSSPFSWKVCLSTDGTTTSRPFIGKEILANDIDGIGNGEEDVNHQLRFGGIDRLYTAHANQQQQNHQLGVLKRLQQSTVVVVGLGGVGSWAAEALARSGIGHLVLIDLDDICISNTNRQMHTLSSTIGKFKIDVLAERFQDLNPKCHVTCVPDFVSADTIPDIFHQLRDTVHRKMGPDCGITAVIDAIDGSSEKSALLAACTDLRIPVITSGGSAGRLDPSKVVCDDLTRVTNDKLLSRCRLNLRKYHGFPEGKKWHEKGQVKRWRMPAVYSTERIPDVPASSSSDSSSLRLCDGSLGTACFVTGSFGFMAASHVVSGIAKGTLKPPRRR